MIPTLDWQDWGRDPDGFTAALGRACRDTGFFLLTGHGIGPALQEQLLREADRLFDLPVADKEKLSILRSPHNRGWAARGRSGSTRRAGRSTGRRPSTSASTSSPTIRASWPASRSGASTSGPTCRASAPRCCATSTPSGGSASTSTARSRATSACPRTISASSSTRRSPRCASCAIRPGPAPAGEIGAGAHTDYGSLTLLLTDGEPGLEVRPRGGDWTPVPHVPGAFVVNIGDCLMRWTNDIYVSTPHRVRPPATGAGRWPSSSTRTPTR
jgi:isopenicillin N synthase-like dioxygenase